MGLILFMIVCLVLVIGLMATGVVLEKDKNKLEADAKERDRPRFFRPKWGEKGFPWLSGKSTTKTPEKTPEDKDGSN